MQRRLAAILATDVVGYSRLVRADEDATLTAVKALNTDLLAPTVAHHNGRVFKLMGDGMLAEFASAVDAVRAAIAIQQAMADHKIELRAGVNLGDVVIDGDDIHGDGVNIAARLESIADPGGIYVSAAVYDQVRDRLDVPFDDLGEQTVKNIDRPIRVWRWAIVATAQAAAPELPTIPSIVVMPFDNMSHDPEQEYFSDGITEDIITDLSKITGLFVIARNSSFVYKGKAIHIPDACRELGVKFALEGSIRKAGNRVRITAQLIDGNTGGHLWAERYDRDLTDIFAVQDDVTQAIVAALKVTLTNAPAPQQVETTSHEAYDLLLRGREQYRLYTRDSNIAARQLFEQAITLDPNYAAAYAALSETFTHEYLFGATEQLDRAAELAQRAKSLDPRHPAMYQALSSVQLFQRQHDAAIATSQQWVDVEPSNAEAYAAFAGILHFSGQGAQAIAAVEKAMRLNPHHPFYYTFYIAQAYFCMERFDDALVYIKRSLDRNPDAMPVHIFRVACFGHLGETALAQSALADLLRIFPAVTFQWVDDFMPYKHPADAARIISGLQKAGLPE